MSQQRYGEQSTSLSSTWKLLTQTAGFVSTVTNRWFQEREDEEDSKEQILVERDIQQHLNRISTLLLEQDAADDDEIKHLDLAVKIQLQKIQGLLEETKGRKRRQSRYSSELANREAFDIEEDNVGLTRNFAADSQSADHNDRQNHAIFSDQRSPARRPVEQDTLTKIFSRVRHNRYKEVEAILDSGVSPEVRDQFGNTLIILACQNGNKRIAKICLRKGCDIDAQNYRGQTALHYCYAFGYHELGEYLQSKGARDDITNESMMTCYDGLEPSEVRLETNGLPAAGASLDPSTSSSRRRQKAAGIRVDPRSYTVEDDTESLTSTASGFSTDTTTDTYPSCSSPTLPPFELDTPVMRRSRQSISTNNWLRHAADLGAAGSFSRAASASGDHSDSAARGRRTVSQAESGRNGTVGVGAGEGECEEKMTAEEAESIERLAEEQAQQLEALAKALRSLKTSRQSSLARSDSDPFPCAHRAGALPSAPAEAPAAAQRSAAAAQALPAAAARMRPLRAAEGDVQGVTQEVCAQRQAVMQTLRAADPDLGRGGGVKPSPPPLPPPPTAKRMLWPLHAAGGYEPAGVSSPGAFSPYGYEAGGRHVSVSSPAGRQGGVSGGRGGVKGEEEGEEEEDLLSARLTCRADGQEPLAQHVP